MWSVFSANVVGLNFVVCIAKSVGVCTFGTSCLTERLKIVFGASATKGTEVVVARILLGDKKLLIYILNKACGKLY